MDYTPFPIYIIHSGSDWAGEWPELRRIRIWIHGVYGFVRKYMYYACHTRVWSNKKPYNSVNRAMRGKHHGVQDIDCWVFRCWADCYSLSQRISGCRYGRLLILLVWIYKPSIYIKLYTVYEYPCCCVAIAQVWWGEKTSLLQQLVNSQWIE